MERRVGIKITLAQARDQHEYGWLVIRCEAVPPGADGCHHAGKMSLLHAITLWGPDRRLDELPLKCSHCGSRKVDVDTAWPRGADGDSVV
jgi:hypothetical protein